MASVTLGVGAADTTNASTYATGAFTPAANDLLLALAGCPATVDAGAYASSDAGKTYGAVTSAVWATGANTFYAFVSGQKADADSQTGTMDVTGDAAAGCAQSILRIAGMTKFSAAAIRQFKVADNQAPDTTPSITFDAACLTGNPTIMAIAGSSTGTPTAPSGWTLLDSQTFATPTTGMKVWSRDSGFTGTTITAGSAYGAGYCLIAVELDASAGAGTMAATETGADDATVAGDVVAAGTLAATEAGADTLAATGTALGAVVQRVRGGDPVPGDRPRQRRIKRETIEKRGRTLREIFDDPGPRIAPQPELAVAAPPAPTTSISRESVSIDATPLIEGLATLRRSLEAAALAQAVDDDDAEVLMVAV